jgi:galactokinase
VNLIGEHTDYNGGFVLPVALQLATLVAAAPRDDRRIVAHARRFGATECIDLDAAPPARRGTWVDYVEGVARALESRGVPLAGSSMLIDGDVPIGAGLASSAALEVAIGLALATVSGRDVDPVEIALAGQAAENDFVGTRSGIMDQYISALAREGHALLIDCRVLEHTPIPLRLATHDIVICDSHVAHDLATSEYNARRDECDEGVALLRQWLPTIGSLRDVSPAAFEAHASRLPETICKRCRHVVTEDERTLAAADALARGDVARAGRLMTQSHVSLRDDYEVSCREIDALVQAALGVAGVAGARMTGGGFGGCTVNLVRSGDVDAFVEQVAAVYTRATGRPPTFIIARASDGANEIAGPM